jgi:crossover junction endodeoxyribonuclease RuvC
MVKLLLGLDAIPKPHDATDALAVAICHLHNGVMVSDTGHTKRRPVPDTVRRWRDYRP